MTRGFALFVLTTMAVAAGLGAFFSAAWALLLVLAALLEVVR